MVPLPPDLSRRYTTHLAHHGVAVAQQPQYSKWLRYYWDFCQKLPFRSFLVTRYELVGQWAGHRPTLECSRRAGCGVAGGTEG